MPLKQKKTYTLIRYVYAALWQIRPDSLKGFHSKPTPLDTWPGFAY